MTFDQLRTALERSYRIECELGVGGMATEYLAHDHEHERDVAMKVLRDEPSASVAKERFLCEIQLVAKRSHPHIIPLYDSGEPFHRSMCAISLASLWCTSVFPIAPRSNASGHHESHVRCGHFPAALGTSQWRLSRRRSWSRTRRTGRRCNSNSSGCVSRLGEARRMTDAISRRRGHLGRARP